MSEGSSPHSLNPDEDGSQRLGRGTSISLDEFDRFFEKSAEFRQSGDRSRLRSRSRSPGNVSSSLTTSRSNLYLKEVNKDNSLDFIPSKMSRKKTMKKLRKAMLNNGNSIEGAANLSSSSPVPASPNPDTINNDVEMQHDTTSVIDNSQLTNSVSVEQASSGIPSPSPRMPLCPARLQVKTLKQPTTHRAHKKGRRNHPQA